MSLPRGLPGRVSPPGDPTLCVPARGQPGCESFADAAPSTERGSAARGPSARMASAADTISARAIRVRMAGQTYRDREPR